MVGDVHEEEALSTQPHLVALCHPLCFLACDTQQSGFGKLIGGFGMDREICIDRVAVRIKGGLNRRFVDVCWCRRWCNDLLRLGSNKRHEARGCKEQRKTVEDVSQHCCFVGDERGVKGGETGERGRHYGLLSQD